MAGLFSKDRRQENFPSFLSPNPGREPRKNFKIIYNMGRRKKYEEDPWSDMSRERSFFESDEDYRERMEDLDDLADYYND